MKEREDLIQKWLWIMLLCSFINPITRASKRDEYDSEIWRTSFTLEISINRSFLRFFSGYKSALKELQCCKENQNFLDEMEMVKENSTMLKILFEIELV